MLRRSSGSSDVEQHALLRAARGRRRRRRSRAAAGPGVQPVRRRVRDARRRPGPSARRRGPGRTRRGCSSRSRRTSPARAAGCRPRRRAPARGRLNCEPAQLAVEQLTASIVGAARSDGRSARPADRSSPPGVSSASSGIPRSHSMRDALALGVADDALAVAPELRIVARQQHQPGQHPGPELVEHACARRSRRRPPSAATPGRGTRCGRAPAVRVSCDVGHGAVLLHRPAVRLLGRGALAPPGTEHGAAECTQDEPFVTGARQTGVRGVTLWLVREPVR